MNRERQLDYGVFFSLEGKLYEIRRASLLGMIYLVEVKSKICRSIPFKIKDGVPIVDIEKLQETIDEISDEVLVFEVMTK